MKSVLILAFSTCLAGVAQPPLTKPFSYPEVQDRLNAEVASYRPLREIQGRLCDFTPLLWYGWELVECFSKRLRLQVSVAGVTAIGLVPGYRTALFWGHTFIRKPRY